MMDKLKPCPKCGRKPKVKIHRYHERITCTIQCKPFLQKPHMRQIVQGRYVSPEETVMKHAVDCWNEKTDCANLPVW